MEHKKIAFCLVFTSLLTTCAVLLFCLYQAGKAMLTSDQEFLEKITREAKVEVVYPLYPGAHHDLYLNSKLPWYLRNKQNNFQNKYAQFVSSKNVYNVQTNLPKNIEASSENLEHSPSIDLFLQKISDSDEKLLRDLIRVFLQIATQTKLKYMLHSESLLGSYRHHGIIPWNQKVDIWMQVEEKESFIEHLKSLEHIYSFKVGDNKIELFKLNISRENYNELDGREIQNLPRLSVSFYQDTGKYVKSLEDNSHFNNFPNSWIYPLHERPFLGFSMNVPRLTKSILGKVYNISACETNRITLSNANIKQTTIIIPCQHLLPHLPFVFRQNYESGTVETLQVGNTEIHTIKFAYFT